MNLPICFESFHLCNISQKYQHLLRPHCFKPACGRIRSCFLPPCQETQKRYDPCWLCNIFQWNCQQSPKITPARQPNMAAEPQRCLLWRAPFLWEDPEDELSLLMGFKGRGDDDILSWRQTESLRHLPQVNVGLAFSFGGCVQEEVLWQMWMLSTHLWKQRKHYESEGVESI